MVKLILVFIVVVLVATAALLTLPCKPAQAAWTQRQLISNTAGDYDPSISADGTKIAFHSNVDGDYEIWAVNADGTGLRQLTLNAASDYHASISADGTKIAFHSNVDGDYEIWAVNADGTGLRQLTFNAASDIAPSISADGTKIAFHSNVDGDYEIYVTFELVPDIVVTNIAFDPAAPVVGDLVHFVIAFANQGTGTSSVCHWSLSPGTSGTIVGVLPSIAPGASTTVDGYFTCATLGTFQTIAVADSLSEDAESNENNNTYISSLTVSMRPIPDIVVTNIAFDPPAPAVGDLVHFVIAFANQGTATSSVCHWSLSPGTTGTIMGVLPSIAPGASTTVDGYFTCATLGTFQTIAAADSLGEVVESNENNNTYISSLTVSTRPIPDIVVTNIAFDPPAPAVGDSVHVVIAFANQGTGTSPVCNWSLAPGTTDNIVGVLPSIAPRASTTVDGYFTCGTVGTFQTIAVADSANDVDESSENNNTYTSSLTVSPAPEQGVPWWGIMAIIVGILAVVGGGLYYAMVWRRGGSEPA